MAGPGEPTRRGGLSYWSHEASPRPDHRRHGLAPRPARASPRCGLGQRDRIAVRRRDPDWVRACTRCRPLRDRDAGGDSVHRSGHPASRDCVDRASAATTQDRRRGGERRALSDPAARDRSARRRYGHGTDHVAARRAARDHDPRVACRLRAQLVAASTAAARGAWRLFREAALLGNRERLHRHARGWSAHRPLAVRREAARVFGELRRRRSRRLRQRMVSDARARR